MDKKTIKILLVEDNEGDILLAKRALFGCSRPIEFIVESAWDLSEAIKHLRNDEKYDIILLDIGLPDSSDIGTVQIVRKATNIPIVVLTGSDEEEWGLSAIKLGAADYLTKDMPLEKFLVRTIVYVLEHKRIEDELKTAYAQLIRSEKLATIGKLAAIVAHELKNPLAVMKNAPEIKEDVDIISDEVNKANKIISDLLQFSRTNKPTLKPEKINVVVRKTTSRLKIPPEIELTMELQDNLPDIELDRQQIEQVFYNIAINAIQAMTDGGRLTIKTNLDSDCIETSITDTGSGIAGENLEKIFEPLFSTKAQGTGLGLPVCALLVEKHGGRIEVESRPKKGTTFIVKLPIAKTIKDSKKISEASMGNSAVSVVAKGE
nr:response regulator [Candidatus Omnitrophota bacterium]